MTSTEPAPHVAVRPPLRLLLTICHLAALGLFGWLVVSLLVILLSLGLATAILLGIGLVFLIGLVYALFGVAWFETERVSGLYRLDLPPLRLRQQREPGFGPYLRGVWEQFVDDRMWRGVASFLIATVLGTALLVFAQTAVSESLLSVRQLALGTVSAVAAGGLPIGMLFGSESPWTGVLAALVSLAAVGGLALLHRLIVIPIATAGARAAELTERVQRSAQQRAGAVRAAEVERTRIERDLHDGVQPRLVSVGMTLGLAQQQIERDPESAKALIAEAHTSTKAAITELRQLARGIHASVLDDRGLDAALSALASRSHIPVVLDVRLPGRCSREAETAVYFAIAESLTNAAKHSRASECRVIVVLRDGHTLWARVEDNGIGGARVLAGGGLDGICNRIQAAGGSVRIDSPQGGPTSLEVSVPCAS